MRLIKDAIKIDLINMYFVLEMVLTHETYGCFDWDDSTYMLLDCGTQQIFYHLMIVFIIY